MARRRVVGTVNRSRGRLSAEVVPVTAERLRELVAEAREDDTEWVQGLLRPAPPVLTRTLIRELLTRTGAPAPARVDLSHGYGGTVHADALSATASASLSSEKPEPTSASAGYEGGKGPQLPLGELPIGQAAVDWARSMAGAQDKGFGAQQTASALNAAFIPVIEARRAEMELRKEEEEEEASRASGEGAAAQLAKVGEELTDEDAAMAMVRGWQSLARLTATDVEACARVARNSKSPGSKATSAASTKGLAGVGDRGGLASAARAPAVAATPPPPGTASAAAARLVPSMQLDGGEPLHSRSMSMAAFGGRGTEAVSRAVDGAVRHMHSVAEGGRRAGGAADRWAQEAASPHGGWRRRTLELCPFASRIVLPECGELLTSLRRFVSEVLAEAEEARADRRETEAAEPAPAELDPLTAGGAPLPGGRRAPRPPPLEVEEGGLVSAERVRAFEKRFRQQLEAHPAFRHVFRAFRDQRRRQNSGLRCVEPPIVAEAQARVLLAQEQGAAPPALSPMVAAALEAAQWQRVLDGAHRLLFTALRPALYPEGAYADRVARHLRSRVWALSWVGPAELDFPAPPGEVKPALRLARDILRAVPRFGSPGDVLEGLAAACLCVSAGVEASLEMQGRSDAGADDVLPCVIWTVLRAGDEAAATLATDLMFAGRYGPAAALRDHRGYFFTSVLSAAEFARGADARMLRMEPAAMEQRMRRAHRRAAELVQREAARGEEEEAGRRAGGERVAGGHSRRAMTGRRAASAEGVFSDSDGDDSDEGAEEGGAEAAGGDGAAEAVGDAAEAVGGAAAARARPEGERSGIVKRISPEVQRLARAAAGTVAALLAAAERGEEGASGPARGNGEEGKPEEAAGTEEGDAGERLLRAVEALRAGLAGAGGSSAPRGGQLAALGAWAEALRTAVSGARAMLPRAPPRAAAEGPGGVCSAEELEGLRLRASAAVEALDRAGREPESAGRGGGTTAVGGGLELSVRAVWQDYAAAAAWLEEAMAAATATGGGVATAGMSGAAD